MAKGPAVVVVARHGARLDASDKAWHLTSPTPYDPPLTYGGWAQARALGQRIAALLHQRDEEHLPEFGLSKPDIKKKKKKRKIIIHSSPFLRCVQTSTAVAAGISQYQLPDMPHLEVPTPSKQRHGLRGSSSLAKPRPSKSPSSQPGTFQPVADPNLEIYPQPHNGPERIMLRIDAFLGEWLSPEYYEDITSPPNSTMMVAGAKADLLRRGDHIQEQSTNSSKGHFPGGWVRKDAAVTSKKSTEKATIPTLGNLAQATLTRERSSSDASSLSLQRTRSREAVAPLVAPTPSPKPSRIYDPPLPSYSVSPADRIPRGYVAHAQDACVKVDFQWDSMRAPQDWGDGGEYGDSWSTMHKRFHRGLAGMMQWYRTHGTTPPKEQYPGFMFREPLRLTPAKSDPFPNFSDDPTAEDDEELVLVLITHGAGCNALVGAITNQPVLVDVGLASLSMAVRKKELQRPSASTLCERRPSVADPGMSDTYEMKLMASVDHLRPGVDPSKPPSVQSKKQAPAATASPSIDSRRRFTGSSTPNSPLETPFSIGEPNRIWNSARRTMSSGTNSRFMQGHSSTSGTASPSSGLWSGTRTPATEGGSDGRASPGADMVLNFANQHPKPKPTTASTSIPSVDGANDTTGSLTRLDSKEEREVGDKSTPLVTTNARNKSSNSSGLWGATAPPKSNNGLWGPPKLDDVYEHEHGPKRRWTVTEREDSL
ncbi:hypothetical protein EJ02DRAFT_451621 [Clathrospora elynae]|uniref:Phosphoglycerate mutase-like protein n=1 Tax=Clathrospora elynae TaxID=706981 RepID=A0A6A5T0Y2_9PLEO|nr:hypothetical protein EJ02DRAFT_451621 [Clathrospora elynae]